MATNTRQRSRSPSQPMCLITAKGESRRFPRKNSALLNGRPLIGYVISAARSSELFDAVCVSTEDKEIAEIATREGASAIDRPPELATDDAQVSDVGIHALDAMTLQGKRYDSIFITYPTAVLLLPEDFRGAWDLLLAERANAVFAVTRYIEHPLHAVKKSGRFLRPAFPKAPELHQGLPEFYVPAGCFYLIRTDVLRERRDVLVPRMAGYLIPRDRSVDIDEPEHLRIAQGLMGLSPRA